MLDGIRTQLRAENREPETEKHGSAYYIATGRTQGWEGKADWGKVRRPAIFLVVSL